MKLKRFFSVCLALLMLCSMLPLQGLALYTDEFQVIISMEGLTLGQGFYVTPTRYTMEEINALLAPQGFGPFNKRNLTAGMATLAMLRDKELNAEFRARWEKNIAYLVSVDNIDKGTLDIPPVITQNGGPSNADVLKNTDRALGELDYTTQSGWMLTVNDFLIQDNIAAFGLENNNTRRNKGFQDYGNTYVLRWQFTLWGAGRDLGYAATDSSGKSIAGFFSHANKDVLYAAYACSSDAAAKNAALPTMQNLTATQAQVDAALARFDPSAAPAPATPADDPNACPYCGGSHGGAFGWLIAFFHSLLALLGLHK